MLWSLQESSGQSDKWQSFPILFRSDLPQQAYILYGMPDPSQAQPCLQLAAASKADADFSQILRLLHFLLFLSDHCGFLFQSPDRSDAYSCLPPLLWVPALYLDSFREISVFPDSQESLPPVPQSSLSGSFLFLPCSAQECGVLPALTMVLRIHNTFHKPTLLPDLLPWRSIFLFSWWSFESSFCSLPHPKLILQWYLLLRQLHLLRRPHPFLPIHIFQLLLKAAFSASGG